MVLSKNGKILGRPKLAGKSSKKETQRSASQDSGVGDCESSAQEPNPVETSGIEDPRSFTSLYDGVFSNGELERLWNFVSSEISSSNREQVEEQEDMCGMDWPPTVPGIVAYSDLLDQNSSSPEDDSDAERTVVREDFAVIRWLFLDALRLAFPTIIRIPETNPLLNDDF